MIIHKVDLTCCSFLIPVRLDSEECEANLNTVLALIHKDFDTRIIILEADIKPRYVLPSWASNATYYFVEDLKPLFHRTRYINQLLQLAESEFIGVWNSDSIVFPEQITESLKSLKANKKSIVFPYTGKPSNIPSSLSDLFRSTCQYEFLQRIQKALPTINYEDYDDVFFVNRTSYIAAGGENEKILAQEEIENAERVKRMELADFNILRYDASLFQLANTKSRTIKKPADKEMIINNIQELISTCSQL